MILFQVRPHCTRSNQANQALDSQMLPFTGMKNRDGLSDEYIQRFVFIEYCNKLLASNQQLQVLRLRALTTYVHHSHSLRIALFILRYPIQPM